MPGSGESSRAIPVIVGPTAIGKTRIGLELADRFNLEIVSCDSRQIYKYLNIGTSKPTIEEIGGRAYHLIDFVEPDRVYSAARYREDALVAIKEIQARGKWPLIVGGTGLYLKALTDGFFVTPDADMDYREELSQLSATELHEKLMEIDPISANSIPRNNKVRVIRALEIAKLTGKTKSELERSGRYPEQNQKFIVLGLSSKRQNIYQLINLRVDKMIRDGLIAEVETVMKSGFKNSPVLARTVGYREVLDYLAGGTDLEKCIDLIKQHTRNYAKRQLTWFRGSKDLVEIDLESYNWLDFLFGEIRKLKLDT